MQATAAPEGCALGGVQEGAYPWRVEVVDTEDRGGYTSYGIVIVCGVTMRKTPVMWRRYSQMHDFHSQLSDAGLKPPPLPGKRLFSSMSTAAIAERRAAIEAILQWALRLPAT